MNPLVTHSLPSTARDVRELFRRSRHESHRPHHPTASCVLHRWPHALHRHVRIAAMTAWRFMQRVILIWGIILTALVLLTTLVPR
jgi:hypothetical protein